MHATMKLAGHSMAHAVWCVSEGETLIPMLNHSGPGGNHLVRFVGSDPNSVAQEAEQFFATNPDGADCATFIYDGYLTLEDWRTDALFLKAVSLSSARKSLELAVPYTAAHEGAKLAVFRPKVLAVEGFEIEQLAEFLESFWAGVDSHAQGAAVWNENLDQSR